MLLASFPIGAPSNAAFLNWPDQQWYWTDYTIDSADLTHIAKILTQYADANLDFTDAAIITLAEQLGFERIATFDRRDFAIVRPRHCDAFELLP